MNKSDLRIVFMGTPDFAVESLKQLHEKGFNIVAVVTSTDKPAGRGKKIQPSAVKKYAVTKGYRILQPENLNEPNFINNLKNLKPDLFIVVAFRILPKIIWEIPKYGTFNLHASLLPQYRGAAPINWAIINGETKTGVTTFFIDEHVDTGNIILQKEVEINKNMTAGELHDELIMKGAELVIETVEAIMKRSNPKIDQSKLINKDIVLKKAPKIYKNDCKINWTKEINEIYNFIRGLSPYPSAFTEFIYKEKAIPIKIFKTEKKFELHNYPIGKIISDQNNFIDIAVKNGFISLKELQQAGKNKLTVSKFLRGFNINDCILDIQ